YGAGRPWWRGIWDAIRPPAKVQRTESRFSAKQKNILRSIAIVVALGVLAAGGYYYVASAPDRAEATFQQGMKFMGPGKYPQAIEYFNKAINTWDRHAQSYLQRGNAEQILGKVDSA